MKTTIDILNEKYPPLLTYANLAEIFQQHTKTIMRHIKKGELPFEIVHIGAGCNPRFRLTEVAQYIDEPKGGKQSKRGRKVGSKNKDKSI